MKLAVVGATGLVGQTILKVLEEKKFPFSELMLVASERSKGKRISYQGREFEIIGLQDAVALKPDVAIFSAGGTISREWTPKFTEAGITVIDNSSAWRMDKNVPLIVPEINGELIHPSHKIIANPNCSTIQVVMALAPLHLNYTVRRLVISTYQSVSGSGQKGISQLMSERQDASSDKAYPHPIDLNCIPQGGAFTDNGYTEEEMKLVNETRRILSSPDIRITSTVVRVPVTGGHSASVNVEFERPFELSDVHQLLTDYPGVTVIDDPREQRYPMPLYAKDKNEVFVGRIRKDPSIENGLDMWVVADNLRKGAATNAVQIAEICATYLN